MSKSQIHALNIYANWKARIMTLQQKTISLLHDSAAWFEKECAVILRVRGDLYSCAVG